MNPEKKPETAEVLTLADLDAIERGAYYGYGVSTLREKCLVDRDDFKKLLAIARRVRHTELAKTQVPEPPLHAQCDWPGCVNDADHEGSWCPTGANMCERHFQIAKSKRSALYPHENEAMQLMADIARKRAALKRSE